LAGTRAAGAGAFVNGSGPGDPQSAGEGIAPL